MAAKAIAMLLLLMGAALPSVAMQLAAHVTEDLVVEHTVDGTVRIQVPLMSTHPCDRVYVFKDLHCGYTEQCYAEDRCRFAYVGTGLTTDDCSNAALPSAGTWITIPGIETLADGMYYFGFSRYGNMGAGGSTSLAELQASASFNFTADSGSVVGDPHVRNLAHKKFEIRAAGQHTLLQIPGTYLSNEKPILLRVDAVVEHLSEKNCNGTFIRNMTIFGNWTSEFGLMKIKSGSDATNTSMLVNGQSPEDFFSHFNSKKVSYGNSYVSLKLGAAIHIAKHYEGRYGMQKGFLNFRVTGLKTYMDVGGLLGYDDHTRAEVPPPECLLNQTSDVYESSFIGLGRSPLPGSGASRMWVE